MTNSYKLRQRAINVLYLVILAYIFLVVPADFVDAVFRSNQSFEHITAESDKLLQLKANYFLNVLKKEDSTLFETTSNRVREIELNEAMLQQYIDSLKDGLIKRTGLTDNGFYKNGKETAVINKWMIKNNTGNLLLQRLQSFNQAIKDALPECGIKLADSIININPVQFSHNGTARQFSNFYFHNTPFNVAIIHLTSFQAEVRSTVSTAYDELFNRVRIEYREKYGRALPGDYMKDQEMQEDKTVTPVEELLVKSLNDSIFTAGESLRYRILSTAPGNPVSVTINGPGLQRRFEVKSGRELIYTPLIKGNYQLLFQSGSQQVTKSIKVVNTADPFLRSEYGTLYIGMDNYIQVRGIPADIKESDLVFTIDNGQIIGKKEGIYARVKTQGFSKIEVFAKTASGRIRLSEQRYVNRELNTPIPLLGGVSNGNSILLSNLKQTHKMTAIAAEPLLTEDVYIAEFDVSLLDNSRFTLSKPLHNKGASLNNIIQSLIALSKPGDILLFSNIRIKSSIGYERVVESMIIYIK